MGGQSVSEPAIASQNDDDQMLPRRLSGSMSDVQFTVKRSGGESETVRAAYFDIDKGILWYETVTGGKTRWLRLFDGNNDDMGETRRFLAGEQKSIIINQLMKGGMEKGPDSFTFSFEASDHKGKKVAPVAQDLIDWVKNSKKPGEYPKLTM